MRPLIQLFIENYMIYGIRAAFDSYYPLTFNTASRPGRFDYSEARMAEARFDRARVLSGGIMVGAAMLLPAFQHEEAFYRYL